MKGIKYSNLSATSLLSVQFDKLVFVEKNNNTLAPFKDIENLCPTYNWAIHIEDDIKSVRQNKIAFYLQSDTLVKSVLPILSKFADSEFIIFIPEMDRENSDTQLVQEGISYEVFSVTKLKAYKPDILVVLNDWTKLAKYVILKARKLNVPTICIQESMIDFGTKGRMQFSDAVFLQGLWYLSKLDVKLSFITGNPRYEHLLQESSNKKNSVLINCNFTYGIYEEVRESWLSDISNVLDGLNIPFNISQHPRDRGNLDAFKNVLSSSASSIHSQLKDSSLVITRFSSLIHEALFFKIPVIYYNPHNESQTDNVEIDGVVVRLARNFDELLSEVKSFKASEVDEKEFDTYLYRNCLSPKGTLLPSDTIANILKSVQIPVKKISLMDKVRMFMYQPTIRKISLFLRRK
ncbi:MAG: hypothetical protein COA58_11770 [Bacteroidetes bacterium]|nr:MAG: hypothetical protein COA58_11770 [Bacteroidota bacterium]